MTEKTAHDNLQLINFRMTPDEIARLDQIALDCGLTRSQLLRNLITTSMDEYDTFKSVGIIRSALTVRDVLEWMQHKYETFKRAKISEELERQGVLKA